MLTVWGRPSAYSLQKVQWFLDELGVEYEHVNVGGALGGLDSKEFLAMNPNGRIPVIQDGEHIIWESNTILRYLAATYGTDVYWNESPVERSQFERWMDWELSSLQPSFLALFWNFYRTPENQRDSEKIVFNRQQCEKYIKILDLHLQQNEYVSGGQFGLGDICVGTCFFRYFNIGIELDRPKNVNEWYARLSDRPCYQRIIKVPFNELKGRLKF